MTSVQQGGAAETAQAATTRGGRVALPPAIVFAACGYLCLIATSEVIVISAPIHAVLLDLVLLAVFLTHAALVRDQDQRRFLTALALAPLIRILSLTLPLEHVPLIYWYGIIAVPLIIATAVAAQIAGLTWESMGLRLRSLRVQAAIATFGVVLGTTEYFILRPAALISNPTWTNVWIPALILLLGTGVTEELVFRGVMQSAARGVFRRYTVLYVSLVFAALHIGYRSVVDFVFVLAVGLLFGYVVERTGSILGTSISHGVANIVLYLVVPFLSLPGFAGTMVHTARLPVSAQAAVVRSLDQGPPAAPQLSAVVAPAQSDT